MTTPTPEGWRLVPEVPTAAMLEASWKTAKPSFLHTDHEKHMEVAWAAMLAAAPSAPHAPAMDAARRFPKGWSPLKEDAMERSLWDANVQATGGDPRVWLAHTLRLFASQRDGGSFAAMCRVMSNEVLTLAAAPHPPAAVQPAGTDAQASPIETQEPHPGQLWHMNDSHHGNVLAIVEGTESEDVWALTTFSRFHGAWIKGYRDVLAGPKDFKSGRLKYLGELPTFACLEDDYQPAPTVPARADGEPLCEACRGPGRMGRCPGCPRPQGWSADDLAAPAPAAADQSTKE